jgi:hypothetical protein
MKNEIMENLEKSVKKELKESKCYRDLVSSILGNFSTEQILEHLLTERLTQQQLIGKVSNFEYPKN